MGYPGRTVSPGNMDRMKSGIRVSGHSHIPPRANQTGFRGHGRFGSGLDRYSPDSGYGVVAESQGQGCYLDRATACKYINTRHRTRLSHVYKIYRSADTELHIFNPLVPYTDFRSCYIHQRIPRKS
eukprot:1315948-Amorphochlora_amoeboformis.AAC.2